MITSTFLEVRFRQRGFVKIASDNRYRKHFTYDDIGVAIALWQKIISYFDIILTTYFNIFAAINIHFLSLWSIYMKKKNQVSGNVSPMLYSLYGICVNVMMFLVIISVLSKDRVIIKQVNWQNSKEIRYIKLKSMHFANMNVVRKQQINVTWKRNGIISTYRNIL